MKTSFKVIRRLDALAIAVFLALIVLPNGFATVPVGSTGIMLTMGKVEDTALPEGMHAEYEVHDIRDCVAIALAE